MAHPKSVARTINIIVFMWVFTLGAGALMSTASAKPLRYATQDEPQTLDPHSANLAVTNRLLGNIYEGLTGRDKDFKLVPWLAVSWTQPDVKTWRFKLRPGVKFHDGSPFTADDVVRFRGSGSRGDSDHIGRGATRRPSAVGESRGMIEESVCVQA